MKPRCEVVVKDVLPAIRAMLVKDLIKKHHLSQTEVARRLGITQPAVSQYLRMERGVVKRDAVFQKLEKQARTLAEDIANDKLRGTQLIEAYCTICKSMSKQHLLCLLHFRAAPYLRGESCSICLPRNRPR